MLTVAKLVPFTPKMWMAVSGVIAAESAFSAHSLTVLIGPALAVILAFYSLRSMQVSIHKHNYDAQKERAEEAERQRDDQREAKHEAITELAAVKLQLEMERRKTDMSEVTETLKKLEEKLEELSAR